VVPGQTSRLLLEEYCAMTNKGKVRVKKAITVPRISAHIKGLESELLADEPLDAINKL
jgi:hypothetical protein